MRTVAIDFDGVIHRYSQGYQDGTAYDEPVTGAFEAIRALMEHYAVYVHSTRDPHQIQDWLARHQFPYPSEIIPDALVFWKKKKILGISTRKVPAIAYIDDRAVRFQDNWPEVLRRVNVLGGVNAPKN